MGTSNEPPQPDDPLGDGPGKAGQLDDNPQAVGEEFFHGFEPVADSVSILRRSLRTPKLSEKYRLYWGYHATASDHRESTDQPTKKLYGKLNITLSAALLSPEGPLWRGSQWKTKSTRFMRIGRGNSFHCHRDARR